MNRNWSQSITILLTITVIILIIVVPTFLKVEKRHRHFLIYATHEKIKDAAASCWNQNKCQGNTITLQDLYNLKYLTKQSDPITKKDYHPKSIIKRDNNKIKLILK